MTSACIVSRAPVGVILFLGGFALTLAGCGGERPGAASRAGATVASEPLVVLAAADVQVALSEIADRYRSRTGQRVELIFGSTGNLTTQIEQGIPGDLFLAANESFIDRLIEGGHALSDTRVLYGIGRIAIVAAPGASLPGSLEDLARPEYRTVAIANPEHAPYGVAAREALQEARVWDSVQPRLVFGENIAQTLQFVRTGNADAGIVAIGLVLGTEAMDHVLIDDRMYAPLRQAAAVLRESTRPNEARAFLAYLTGSDGQEVLRRFGFARPSQP
jgi:molybdate transport system substrate-binding protein